MKNLTKVLTLVMVLFIIASCSEDLLQNENSITENEDLSLLKCTPPDDCQLETAWANGIRYVPRGNWAMYTPTPGELPAWVYLIAGKNKIAGKVWFIPGDEPETIIIKIWPDDCWDLQDVSEAIKIQGYNTPPFGNPAPGRFTTYKGNGENVSGRYYKIIVPIYDYYGIHVDVIGCCE